MRYSVDGFPNQQRSLTIVLSHKLGDRFLYGRVCRHRFGQQRFIRQWAGDFAPPEPRYDGRPLVSMSVCEHEN